MELVQFATFEDNYVENDEDIRAIFSCDEWDYLDDIEAFYNGTL